MDDPPSRRLPRPSRTLAVAAGGWLLAGVLGLVLLLMPRPAQPLLPPPTGTGSAAAGSAGPSADPAAPAPSGLFLGDGFTAGSSGDDADSFACATAAQLGWTCVNAGVPGTGYLGGGTPRDTDGSYAARLAALKDTAEAEDVAYLVISGGGVDARKPAQALAAAGTTLLALARDAFPRATIVVVAPFTFGRRPSPAIEALTAALQDAAPKHDVTFVDPSSWFDARSGRTLLRPNGSALTPAGRDHLAARLAEVLAALPPR